MRFMTYTMGDDSQPLPPPSAELMAEMGAFMQEATKAGVLVATGSFAPSAEAVRVRHDGSRAVVVDGPFAETKELIGGWAIMEVRDEAEIVEWTKRFLAIAGGGEATIRRVYGPDDLPPGFDPSTLS
jgi:hypothetical protein